MTITELQAAVANLKAHPQLSPDEEDLLWELAGELADAQVALAEDLGPTWWYGVDPSYIVDPVYPKEA